MEIGNWDLGIGERQKSPTPNSLLTKAPVPTPHSLISIVSYCVNPDCPKPQNPDINNFCQGCGFNLLLQARYRAVKLIAQGGFGRTFIAVDEGQSPALPCVIKQLWTRNLNPEALPKATALFQQEALRLQELGNHPQLPTLLAYFEQNQLLYLVQELIDGSNLAQVVAESGIFNQAQIWQLLDDLLPVIKFIHDHQIIHRDIKPENIIVRFCSSFPPYKWGMDSFPENLTPQPPSLQGKGEYEDSPLLVGEGLGERSNPGVSKAFLGNESVPPYQGAGQFVLVDFGAAKLLTGTEILEKGTRIGSPEYVAPEQVRGKAVFASDLYSLGVTCIYLLTGIAPFDLFDVVNDCWAWRDYLTQEVSVSLTQILDKLLAYPLTHRFQSVEEVMQAIKVQENNVGAHGCAPLPITPMLWQCLYTLDHHAGVNSVAISPDGMLLASGGNDHSIRLWDIDTRAVMAILKAHTAAVKSVAFSPDGTILASSSDDQTIKLWNLSDRQEIFTLSGHSHAVKSVAFSPNHHLLASGSWDKTIKLWDIHKGLLERTLTGHNLQVTAVAFSPCGKLIASASCDRTVRLWELASGWSSTLVGHYRSVVAVAFSPDGTMLATGSDDNTVILWNLTTEKPLYTLSGHSWSVVAVAFSPDGETLVTGSWDKTIKLWQVSSGKEIATLTGHLDSVCAVAISANGELIASGSKDKTVKVLQIFWSLL